MSAIYLWWRSLTKVERMYVVILAMIIISGLYFYYQMKFDRFFDDVERGNFYYVNKILNQHPDYLHKTRMGRGSQYTGGRRSPTVHTDTGRYPLNMAVYRGHKDIVKLMIDKGADVNQPDRDRQGLYPLHYAVIADINNSEIMEMLLKAGARTDCQEPVDLRTPLFLAVYKNKPQLVEILASKGANVNKRDKHLQSPLHQAVSNNNLKMVEILIKNGADANIKNQQGKTPLNMARDKNSEEIIEFLSQTPTP